MNNDDRWNRLKKYLEDNIELARKGSPMSSLAEDVWSGRTYKEILEVMEEMDRKESSSNGK